MSLLANIVGFSLFGFAARVGQLGIQKRPIFESASPVPLVSYPSKTNQIQPPQPITIPSSISTASTCISGSSSAALSLSPFTNYLRWFLPTPASILLTMKTPSATLSQWELLASQDTGRTTGTSVQRCCLHRSVQKLLNGEPKQKAHLHHRLGSGR